MGIYLWAGVELQMTDLLASELKPELLSQEERNRLLLWTARSQCANTKRNDPCPCGSGKKFKVCCLPKFK